MACVGGLPAKEFVGYYTVAQIKHARMRMLVLRPVSYRGSRAFGAPSSCQSTPVCPSCWQGSRQSNDPCAPPGAILIRLSTRTVVPVAYDTSSLGSTGAASQSRLEKPECAGTAGFYEPRIIVCKMSTEVSQTSRCLARCARCAPMDAVRRVAPVLEGELRCLHWSTKCPFPYA